jgi:hypothetical protein
MTQMTAEVCKLLEQALSLSVEEQEALAESLISNLGGKVDEGVQQAWEAEIGKRLAESGLGQSAKDRSMVGSSHAQFGKTARCALIRRSFTRKPLPNMTRRLTGIWSRARMPPSSLTLKWIGHWRTSCKLLNDGQPARIPRAGFCSGNSLLS